MSESNSCLKIIAENDMYQYSITSCNPDVPVTFVGAKQSYSPERLEYDNYLGDRFGLSEEIEIFATNLEPTIENENPIKLSVMRIAPTEGKPVGDTAVLYGYFLEPDAQGLNFYLNQEQSQQGFQYGESGIQCIIDNDSLTITLQ